MTGTEPVEGWSVPMGKPSEDAVWFRPRWSDEEALEPLHLLVTPTDEPYEERAACGQSWPKKLNHGSFETHHPAYGIPPSTETICPRCVAIYRSRQV